MSRKVQRHIYFDQEVDEVITERKRHFRRTYAEEVRILIEKGLEAERTPIRPRGKQSIAKQAILATAITAGALMASQIQANELSFPEMPTKTVTKYSVDSRRRRRKRLDDSDSPDTLYDEAA